MLAFSAHWPILADLFQAHWQVLRNVSVGFLNQETGISVFLSLSLMLAFLLSLYAGLYFSLYSLFGLKSIFPSLGTAWHTASLSASFLFTHQK